MASADSGGWLKALKAVSAILVKANRRSDAVAILSQAVQGEAFRWLGLIVCLTVRVAVSSGTVHRNTSCVVD
jgi:hypothetical protein